MEKTYTVHVNGEPVELTEDEIDAMLERDAEKLFGNNNRHE